MRLLAWGCALGLAACQLVAGNKEGSTHGPCTTNSECPANETCVAAHCQANGTSGAAGSGAKGGSGGTGGAAPAGGKSMGGSAGSGGSSASAGGSGMSQGGSTVARGGDGGAGGVSGSGGDAGSGDAGDGGAGDTTGAGGVGGAGGGGTSGAGGGGAGAGASGAGGVAGTSAGTGGGGMAGTAGTGPGPTRIMPLGDGITASTCLRAFLWKELTDNAYPAFDFVGTRTAGDTCAPTEYDKQHEGHSGYRVTDLLSATSLHTDSGGDPYTGSSADLAAWFDGHPADIVLMLFGSNDLLSTSSTATDIQSAYSAILTKLRSVNSHVTLLVGLLPPMSSSKCNTSCSTRLSDVNTAIPGWAASANTTDSRVVAVDLFTGFDTTNTTDGIKPNDVGAQFLADRWYAAIQAL